MTMMTEERRTQSTVVVMILITVFLPDGGGSTGSDSSPPTNMANGAVRLPSAVVDSQRAELSRRQHLEALFNRYGENGSVSLAGLRRLLQNVGLDRTRTVTVQHREQPGHHPHRHRHENHLHHHRHDDLHHQKRAGVSAQIKVPKSPEVSKDQDSHNNPDNKKSMTLAQGVDPTPPYSVRPMVKPEKTTRQDRSLCDSGHSDGGNCNETRDT